MAAGKVTSPKSILVMILVATLAFALVVQDLEAAASEDIENMPLQKENAAEISRRVLQAMGSYTLDRTKKKKATCGKCKTDADCLGCPAAAACETTILDHVCV